MNAQSRPLLYCLALVAVIALTQPALGQGLTCSIAPITSTEADKAFTAGDSARAETLFITQVAAAPTSPNFSGLVRAQLDQDKLPEALASAQHAVAALGNSATAQALLGDVLVRSGQIPEASDAYTKALATDRCSATAHFGLGRLNDLVGRHLSAAKNLNFAHRLAPNNPEITAAWIKTLPLDQRLPALRTLVSQHPALPPAQLDHLTLQQAVLEQHLTCATEPFTSKTIGLLPLLQNGRYRRSWGFKPTINDAALPLLELDSSVDGIVLNADDAAKAHVRPLAPNAASPTSPYPAVAGTIHIGDLTYRDCLVTVVPNSAVDNRNSLIGTSFFRDSVIHIDYVATTLTLTPLPAPPTGTPELTDQFLSSGEKDWTPVYVAGPNVLVPTLINKKGPFLFALDTGVNKTVLSPAITDSQLSSSKDVTINLQGSAAVVVKVIPRDGGGDTDVADVHGPDGKIIRVGRPVKLPVYRFATSEIPDDTAVSFNITPMSHADGIEISALLGFHILSYFSIEINYRDALAHIVFDQNRRYHVQQNDRDF